MCFRAVRKADPLANVDRNVGMRFQRAFLGAFVGKKAPNHCWNVLRDEVDVGINNSQGGA